MVILGLVAGPLDRLGGVAAIRGGSLSYYPDFLVKLSDKRTVIVETKGQEDLDVPLKIQRLQQWCEDVNARQREVLYEWLLVDQESFENITPEHSATWFAAAQSTKSMNKSVLYARVSSREQEQEGFSIPAQLKLLKEYAARQGMEIVQEFVDVETAKQAGRTAFGEMVGFLKESPSVQILLVEKTDRLYRNFRDYVIIDYLDIEPPLVRPPSTAEFTLS